MFKSGLRSDVGVNVTINPLDQLRAWQRFHIRLTALYGGTVLLTLVLMAYAFYWLGVSAELQALQRRLLATATSLAHSINADELSALPVDDIRSARLQAELLLRFKQVATEDPDVESIYILTPTAEPTKLRFFVDYVKQGEAGKPGDAYEASELPILLKGFVTAAVENEPYKDDFGLTLSGYAPLLTTAGKSIGVLGLDVAADRITFIKQRAFAISASLFAVAVLLVGIASLLVARNVRDPLTRLINATAAIARGDLTIRLKLQRNDEFGLLATHFDYMTTELQQREMIRATFGRYVSEDVARTLLSGGNAPTLGGEERIVTILFCDLRGYTTISEQLSPGQVVELLNLYFSAMNAIVDEHRGCIIEFLGDAILAVFGAPIYVQDHSERALRCALMMRERLSQLNAEWDDSPQAQRWWKRGVSKLEARMGIHTGPVVAGNLGSPERMKYAVIGDSVNIAARLEELNKELNTSILISDEVRARVPQDLQIAMRPHGEHKVKGRLQVVNVYAI